VRVFFATDIHGSEICWRKFLNAAAFYKADAVILGGDVTGKVMVPITEHNGYWQVVMGGETVRLDTREELAEASGRSATEARTRPSCPPTS
jgi:Icc-related predicted phosphoesterase